MTSLSNSSTGFKLPRPRTVAVIGAGPAGLTAAKQAIAFGHTVTVFEQHDGLGGIWHPEGGGAYPSVRMQTSRSAFHYSDHPPALGEGGEFLTLREMADYFRSYADRFEVLDKIRFSTRVERVRRGVRGWEITTCHAGGSNTEEFDGVMVAIGELWQPKTLECEAPGSMRFLTAKQYHSAEPFLSKRTLVVGGGVSGADIAAEIAAAGGEVDWSVRRRYFFLPRKWGAFPNDGIFSYIGRIATGQWPSEKYVAFLAELMPNYMTRYAECGLLPRVACNNAVHVNDTIIDAVARQEVAVRAPLQRLTANGAAQFEDGSEARYDHIILCLGYEAPCYRFIDGFQSEDLSDCFFYNTDPTLAVINIPQNVDGFGTACPYFEAIAGWVLAAWNGACSLTAAEERRRSPAPSRKPIGAPMRCFYDCWPETIRIGIRSGQVPDPAREFDDYWTVVSSAMSPLNLDRKRITPIPAPFDARVRLPELKLRLLASLTRSVRHALAANGQIRWEEEREAARIPETEALPADFNFRTERKILVAN